MKLAALDVGSNTVLMLVTEVDADGRPQRIADLSRITRLGRGVDAGGRLDPEAAEATLDAIVEFSARARALGAERIVGAATAALRDASDREDFTTRVKQRTGVTLEIIGGNTEAELSYLSTQKGLALDTGSKLLIVDIGGGSTELIQAQPGQALAVVSLQIGSVRLTERTVHHDPPQAREITGLRDAVANVLRQAGWQYRPDSMVGIGGTVSTLCAIELGLTQYSPDSVHGHPMAKSAITRLIGVLGSLPLEQRKKLPGMEPGRADVLLAGAVILECIMDHFNCEQVIVSDQGVRWGLIWRELEKPSVLRSSGAGEA
jgi:exopolyphosphatase / guanosine-5'-triphosphate,3'-diphosphate pyrophosphatase